jgi:putative pyruvate formate lyase activating enzyme
MERTEDIERLECLTDPRIREIGAEALREYGRCRLCVRDCGTNRRSGQRGSCGASTWGEVFYAGLLVNEESDLNPAYEVFFTGCNLDCGFCYLRDKVRGKASSLPLIGHPFFQDPGLKAARSINAVGGEPGVNLLAALHLFDTVPVRPRVWNSNMIYSSFVAKAVAEVADVVVADIHFGSDRCAREIAGSGSYLEPVLNNIEHACSARLTVIVRHLLLPGHEDCCGRAVLRIMAERFPDLRFHLLANYLPPRKGQTIMRPELSREVSPDAAARLRDEALKLGLRLEPAPDRMERESLLAALRDRGALACWEQGEIIIEPSGRMVIPHLTPQLLEVVAGMEDIEHGDD